MIPRRFPDSQNDSPKLPKQCRGIDDTQLSNHKAQHSTAQETLPIPDSIKSRAKSLDRVRGPFMFVFSNPNKPDEVWKVLKITFLRNLSNPHGSDEIWKALNASFLQNVLNLKN